MPLRELLLGATILASCADARATDADPPAPPENFVPVAVSLAPKDTALLPGATMQYRALLLDANGRGTAATAVTWISRDPTIMVVDSTGVARAVGPGQTVIVATRGTFTDSAGTQVIAPEQPSDVTVQITTTQRTPISRFIYGMNLTGDTDAPYTNNFPWYGARPPAGVTLDRFGGNRFSAYNWENNYSHAGVDYQHNNDEFLSSSRTPGAAVFSRVTAARRRGAATIVTVPMIGYVAADGLGPVDTTDLTRASRLALRFRQSVPNKPSALSASPNVNDATVYQDEFVFSLMRAFPGAATESAAPILFSLDNEPDSWHGTHKAILGDSLDDPNRPRLQTYEGFLATTLSYATAIKRVAPGAVVMGPAFATYAGVLTLGRYPKPDPQHGSRSFVEFYIERIGQAEQAAGKRLVDVLDIHWYPATGTARGEITNDYAQQDGAMVNARLQAPRSLWDPTFNENSWVSEVTNGPVALLPRLRDMIQRYNPGMKIAISEYYFGRSGDISGGLAQADILGIFGREGVFAAAMWPQAGVWAPPYAGSGDRAYAYAFGAFRSFLDYDGRGARFGDIGVATTVTDAVQTSAYGSVDAEGRVIAVVINKASTARRAAVALVHPTVLRTAKAYVMRDGVPVPTLDKSYVLANNRVVIDVPPYSVTTLQITP